MGGFEPPYPPPLGTPLRSTIFKLRHRADDLLSDADADIINVSPCPSSLIVAAYSVAREHFNKLIRQVGPLAGTEVNWPAIGQSSQPDLSRLAGVATVRRFCLVGCLLWEKVGYAHPDFDTNGLVNADWKPYLDVERSAGKTSRFQLWRPSYWLASLHATSF